MRIIAGKLRSRKLETRQGNDTRPTSDKIKEAIFSSVSLQVTYGKVLDLFSGSGAIALEAISRGFQEAWLCDISKEAIHIINKNIQNLGVEKQCHVLQLDYPQVLKQAYSKQQQFDFIYIDPPYHKVDVQMILQMMNTYQLVAKNGIIICETSKEEVLQDTGELHKYKEKEYGNTRIHYYKRG